jgi:hypothetical protein
MLDVPVSYTEIMANSDFKKLDNGNPRHVWPHWFYNVKDDLVIFFTHVDTISMSALRIEDTYFNDPGGCAPFILEVQPCEFIFTKTAGMYSDLWSVCIQMFLKNKLDVDVKIVPDISQRHKIVFDCQEDADYFKMMYAHLL